MPKAGHPGWGRSGHRRAVVVGALVVLFVGGSGVAAWAAVSGGSTGYRLGRVTQADIGTTLTVVGNLEPVSDASAAFGVGGQVTSVTVSPGQQVSAGQTLATLDTTAMSDSVSSDQSALNADQAKLAEDEASQSSTASSSSSSSSPSSSSPNRPTATAPSSTTTTTTPTNRGAGGSGGQGGGSNPVVTQDQSTLTQDESTLSTDQQKEAADLAQAQSDCTSANTGTPAGQAACVSALQTVSADEQQVSKDQQQVSKDETALGQALGSAGSGGTGSGGTGSGPTSSAGSPPSTTGHADASLTSDVTGNSGAGGSGNGEPTGTPSGTNGDNSTSSSSNSDTPAQIASDQAAIDSAMATLTEAQQSLNAATLTSPINGTVVSVGIDAGATVSANSSTEIITIVGTSAYEAQATLDSSQVPSVKIGQSAGVQVDGVNGPLEGTVAQVGPVQSSSSGYTYPVVVALPASSDHLYAGSAANIIISTGEVSHVVAVPTSAVQTLGTRSYVMELANGQLTRKVIQVGMVGDVYTQVVSGLSVGQNVVLADYAEAVPSSNTNTIGGVGSLLGGGGGGGGFLGGGGKGFFQRVNTGGGGAVSVGG